MRLSPFNLLALAAFGGPALGQAINIDVDAAFGVPSATYAAASAQDGTWNLINFGAAGAPLNDTAGAVTTVTLTQTGGTAAFSFNNALTGGDDEALIDDLIDIGGLGGAGSVTIDGLGDGDYDVYAYAFAPDSNTFATDISATPSTSPLQTVGPGNWPGMHGLGMTYAFFDVTINGGGSLTLDYNTNTGFGSINGIQIVPDGPGPIGTSYCSTAVNSAGSGALITASGSTSVAAMSLALEATGLPPNVNGIVYYGTMQSNSTFGDGIRCVGGVIQRLPFNAANASGVMSEPDVFSLPMMNLPIAPGVLNFQAWFRDAPAMMSGFNLSDGVTITFVP